LFSKNKDNPVILADIKDELSNRKTPRSKLLKNEVDKLNDISLNKGNEKKRRGKNLEEFLKSVTLKEFVLEYDVPIRLQHMILPELNFIKFNTIYDFIVSTEDERASLLRLPGFGKKSLNHLRFAIEDLIKEKLNIDYFDQSINELMCKIIIVEDNNADKIIMQIR